MQPTIYSYFRGGNGVGIGAELAGYRDIGGVEFDAQIAAVCDANFPHAPTTIADVCAVDPALLLDVAPDWFHASPSCKNASQAKTAELDEDGNTVRETEADRGTGQAVARFIAQWTPPLVTIENVWQYRTFDAFGAILQALRESGYSFDYWHLNAADYGVPQTRKRLILKARRGLMHIQRPNPTHRKDGDMFHAPWVGWYAAIEDLIPTLPDSQFAAWQLARLPEDMRDTALIEGTEMRGENRGDFAAHPSGTIKATTYKGMPRAFIVGGANTNKTIIDSLPREAEMPMFTVPSGHGGLTSRAFIVAQGCYGDSLSPANHHEPTFAITANSNQAGLKAFLMRDDNAQQQWGKGYRGASEPAMTTRPDSQSRAFVVDCQESSSESGLTIRQEAEPIFTISASMEPRRPARAWLSHGRVVKMTARALARFQSLPDSYALPDKSSLACTVIGNMVPPLLIKSLA